MLFIPKDFWEKWDLCKNFKLLLKCYLRTNAAIYIQCYINNKVLSQFLLEQLEQTYFCSKLTKLGTSIQVWEHYIIVCMYVVHENYVLPVPARKVFPEQLWMPHLCRCSKPGWTGCWDSWCGGNVPACGGGGLELDDL